MLSKKATFFCETWVDESKTEIELSMRLIYTLGTFCCFKGCWCVFAKRIISLLKNFLGFFFCEHISIEIEIEIFCSFFPFYVGKCATSENSISIIIEVYENRQKYYST